MRQVASTLLALTIAGALSAQTPAPAAQAAAGVVDGIVTNSELAPLPNSTISILGSAIHVSTGDNGRFRVYSLPSGRYIFVVHRVGFVPYSTTIDVAAGDTVRPSFSLEPVAAALDTVVVKAMPRMQRLSEFESRRHAGLGYFVKRDMIDDRHTRDLTGLLRPVMSVTVVDRGGKAYATRGGACAYNVYVDGLPAGMPADLNQLPKPEEIAGIEIYSNSALAPPMYGRSTQGCGVILIWTIG